VPIAHGEGRFTSTDKDALKILEEGDQVAFRYCDENGKIDSNFPITPNGAQFATAMIVNKEGTVGAIMPHPERFYDNFDGDQIMVSMRKWIEEKKSPESVEIGDFSKAEMPEIPNLELEQDSIVLEKKLLITDNESFSVSQTASNIAGEKIEFEKSLLYEINIESDTYPNMKQQIIESGLILNENKEVLMEPSDTYPSKYAVLPLKDDSAVALGEKLSALSGTDVSVRIFQCWNFGEASSDGVAKVLQNRLLANPNSAGIFKV
jgi:hypothetical protein